MATQEDIRLGARFDINQPVKDRTYNQTYHVQFYSGDTLYDFDFSVYDGAYLDVKTKATDTHYILRFTTTDGSITLGQDGRFNLTKTDEEMHIPANDYHYDMYLTKATGEKRDFLFNKFKVNQNVTY